MNEICPICGTNKQLTPWGDYCIPCLGRGGVITWEELTSLITHLENDAIRRYVGSSNQPLSGREHGPTEEVHPPRQTFYLD